MAEIIKFPDQQARDDALVGKFIDSLKESQRMIFFEIVEKAKQEYDDLYATTQDIAKKYIEKVNECEMLKRRKDDTKKYNDNNE